MGNAYNENKKDNVCDIEFDDDFKARLIDIIERSAKGEISSDADATLLFHWLAHQGDPAYDFVPKKYRTTK